MWSTAALAADAADDAPRASMIAAPRLATVGMKVFSIHSSSTCSATGLPPNCARNRSGYWVAEWLPHTTMLVMSSTETPSFLAAIDSARLWSSRIIALKRDAGMSGAFCCAISALVLAGLPTTRILTSSAAPAFSASPCGLKMPPLADSRSPRSMPGPRGRAPTSRATPVPSKAFVALSVISMLSSSGKAQSSSSMAVPSAAFSAGVISSRLSLTGVSGPSICPDAIRNSSA